MLISAAKASEAADVLGVLLEGLTPSTLGKAYRNKAKDCHPDHHGSAKLSEWSRVSWAKECLERWIAQHPTEEITEQEPQGEGNCRACSGTGRVVVGKRAFGKPLTMQCIICKGLGTIIPEEHDHD